MSLVVKLLNSFLGKMGTSSSYNCYYTLYTVKYINVQCNNTLFYYYYCHFWSLCAWHIPRYFTNILCNPYNNIITSQGDFINLRLKDNALRDEIIFSKSHNWGPLVFSSVNWEVSWVPTSQGGLGMINYKPCKSLNPSCYILNVYTC